MPKNSHKKRRALLTATAGLLAVESFGIARGDVLSNWDGGSGNWSDSAHWTPAVVPNNGNHGTNYAVLVTGGALTLDIPVTINPLTFSGGIISGTSTLNALQLLRWTGGTFGDGTGGGTTTASGSLVIGGSADKTLSAHQLVNAGTGTWGGAGSIFLGFGAVLENRGTFNATNDASIVQGNGDAPMVLNRGVFNKSSLSDTGVTTIGIPFNNSGTVRATRGILDLAGGGTDTGGSWATSAGATIRLSTSFTFSGAATGSGAGTVEFGGDGISCEGSFVNGAQTLLSTGNFGGSGTLSTTGLLTWTGGQFGGGAGTTIASGGLVIDGLTVKYMNDYRLVNAATANWIGADAIRLGTGAVLENRGTFNAISDASIFNSLFFGTGTFLNSGAFNKTSASGTGVTTIGIPFNNSGTVNVNSGVLYLYGGGTATGGTFAVATGGKLLLGGGTFDLDAASKIGGAGTVSIDAAYVNLKNLTLGTLLVNSFGILTVATNGARATISVKALTIGSSGLIDLQNNFMAIDNTATPFVKVHQYIGATYNIDPATGIGDYTGIGGITSTLVKTNADFMGVGYYNGALQSPTNPDYVGQILGPHSNSGAGTGIPLSQILVRPTLTGDLNGDGVVNSYDVTLFNTFGLFNQPTNLGYQAGDLNGDGVVNAKDVTIFNTAGNFNNGSYLVAKAAGTLSGHSASPAAALNPSSGTLSFTYDPATGDVKVNYNGFTGFAGKQTFNTTNRALSLIDILSTGGPFALDATKLTAEAKAALSSPTITGNTEINLTAVNGYLPDGTDLGRILAPGLDAAQLAGALTLTFNYTGSRQLSGGVAGLIVPEPATFSLIGFGALGLLARRRGRTAGH